MGNAAPPDRQNLRLDRSKDLIFGWFMMALNRVGTPGMIDRLGAVDEGQRIVEDEARHDDDLGALGDAEVHHHGHREHVEERQDTQHLLLAVDEIRCPRHRPGPR